MRSLTIRRIHQTVFLQIITYFERCLADLYFKIHVEIKKWKLKNEWIALKDEYFFYHGIHLLLEK